MRGRHRRRLSAWHLAVGAKRRRGPRLVDVGLALWRVPALQVSGTANAGVYGVSKREGR